MSTEVTIDLSNYKDRVGGRVTPGTYTVSIDDVEVGKASSGNMMITVWLQVVSGEFAGTQIIDRLTQTPAAMFRTVNFMQALGLPTPKKRLQLDFSKFIGRRVDVELEDGDPYRGRVKSEVRGYSKASVSAAESTDLEDVSDASDASNESSAEEEAIPASSQDSDEPVDLTNVELG